MTLPAASTGCAASNARRSGSARPFSTSPLARPVFYYFLLAVFAAAVTLMGLLLRSPFGRTLLAIRENERRARFLGIPVERHIWMSFSLSCFFTALAGTLYALLNNFADPLSLHYSLSGEIVIMTVMGGMRTFWGPLVGAAVFVVLQRLHLEHDGKLDVLHRASLRLRGAVLPARHPRLPRAKGPGVRGRPPSPRSRCRCCSGAATCSRRRQGPRGSP